MRGRPFQKIASIFMMVMVLTLIPFSFCQGECYKKAMAETCQNSDHATAAVITHVAVSNPRVGAPLSGTGSIPAQMIPGFHCPCVLPMPPEQAEFASAVGISKLLFFEPYKAVPEVFLAKYIPPA